MPPTPLSTPSPSTMTPSPNRRSASPPMRLAPRPPRISSLAQPTPSSSPIETLTESFDLGHRQHRSSSPPATPSSQIRLEPIDTEYRTRWSGYDINDARARSFDPRIMPIHANFRSGSINHDIQHPSPSLLEYIDQLPRGPKTDGTGKHPVPKVVPVGPDSGEIECDVCREVIETELFYPGRGCNHVYCRDCLVETTRAASIYRWSGRAYRTTKCCGEFLCNDVLRTCLGDEEYYDSFGFMYSE